MARTLTCGGTSKFRDQVAFGYGLFTGGWVYIMGRKIGASVIPISGEYPAAIDADGCTTVLACTLICHLLAEAMNAL